jgi:hypothetical protein
MGRLLIKPDATTAIAYSDLLPTTISSSIIMRSPMSTKLIIMVLGSTVESTDELPFSVLGTIIPHFCSFVNTLQRIYSKC